MQHKRKHMYGIVPIIAGTLSNSNTFIPCQISAERSFPVVQALENKPGKVASFRLSSRTH